jgi:hypothetical protein
LGTHRKGAGKEKKDQSNEKAKEEGDVDETVDRPAAHALFQNSSEQEDVQDKDFEKRKNLLGEDDLPGLFSNVGELLMAGKGGIPHCPLKPKGEGRSNTNDKKDKRNNGDRIVESDRAAVTSYADQTLGWKDTNRSPQ